MNHTKYQGWMPRVSGAPESIPLLSAAYRSHHDAWAENRDKRPGKMMAYLMVMACFFWFCEPGFPAGVNCNAPRNLSERTVCGNISLSKLDQRDAILYQKAIAIDPVPTRAIRKEALTKSALCGDDLQCLAYVYVFSAQGYFDIIEKGALGISSEDPGGGSKRRHEDKKEKTLPAVQTFESIFSQQQDQQHGALVNIVLVTGIVSFLVTWRVFDFFLSLHNRFDLSPFEYYRKKIGYACTVSIVAMVVASRLFS